MESDSETAELFTSVLELVPSVTVFDCDGTLWAGDAGSSFMHWTAANGVVGPEGTNWLAARYQGYRAGSVPEVAICGEMVQVFAGIKEDTIKDAARAFFAEQIEGNIFPELMQLVQVLQRRGAAIWAVSSTCHWVIEEGVRRFGIPAERVLAARVRVLDGLATRDLLDVPTDEGKVVSLARAGVTRPDAVFGNSVHDAAMLRIARRAFPVNPTRELVEISGREGWSVYWPKSVRPR